MKDGFEEIEHEFPVGKKQDYLLGCFSLGPGSALGEKGKKIGERSKLTPDNRWDRFAHRYLSFLARFFPFPPPRPPPPPPPKEPGPKLGMFRSSRKFSASTTQRVVFHFTFQKDFQETYCKFISNRLFGSSSGSGKFQGSNEISEEVYRPLNANTTNIKQLFGTPDGHRL